ncbi:MAG: hypothetical protein ACI849_001558 [Patiriisocius sp.]|jgi:hypothetical protein
MKKIKYFALVLLGMISVTLDAQEAGNDETATTVHGVVDFYVTQPMRDYPYANPLDVPAKEHPRGYLSQKRQAKADFLNSIGESPTQIDPLVQTAPQTRLAEPPIINIPGITSFASPPDPTGAVGPNHYVQMTNTGWSVWDKSGNQAPGFPKNLSNPLGSGSGDPIVLYDREADRWMITQFRSPFSASASRFVVAISQTNDPTGSYNVFTFNPNGTIDYPHFGIYGNSIVITGNFSPTGRMYALNREKLINGDSSAEMVSLQLPSYRSGLIFNAPQPAHSEGAGIASGSVPIVWMQDNAFSGVSTDHLKVWSFDVNWSNPSSASVSAPTEVPMASYDSFIGGTGGDPFANLEQPNTSQRIDALVNVVNFQTHRYDFGSHESMVVNFAVEIVNGSKISGLRWMELRRTGTNPWTLFQEGTFTDPSGDESVFMGAMGMDQEGNMALAYIKTGSESFPSLYFTGRKDGDDLGQMTLGETLIIEGSNRATNSRYGDYGQLTRDPVDDLTFWYTSEYSGSAGGRKTRIASFKVSDIVLGINELDESTSELTVTSSDNTNFTISLVTETTSDILRLAIFDVTGKRVVYQQVEKGGSNTYNTTIDMSRFATGTYIVNMGNAKSKLNAKILVK